MATAKLTLSVDKDTILIAKEVAFENNMSVSKLFKKLINDLDKNRAQKKEFKMRPLKDLPEWIQQLVVATEPTPDFDHKAEYHKHLEEKYDL